MALVTVRVRVAFEVGEAKPAAARHTPHLLLLVEHCADPGEDHPGSLDCFNELRPLPADHQPDCIGPILVGVDEPITEHTVGLAAATRAAEEDFEARAGDERGLRPCLCAPRDGGYRSVFEACCVSHASTLGAVSGATTTERTLTSISCFSRHLSGRRFFSQFIAAPTSGGTCSR